MTSSVAAWDESGPAEPAVDWSRLGNVYLFANGKGGVGKSTCSTHGAALLAADGARVLLVDLNGQGNVATMLGFANTEADDKGRNLYSAITAGAALSPVRDVRPGLDVVPGGPFVRRIAPVMAAEMGNSQSARQVLMSLGAAAVVLVTHTGGWSCGRNSASTVCGAPSGGTSVAPRAPA